MKKLSISAMLMLALVAGCGGFSKCDEALTKPECAASFFKSGAFKCKWDDKANDNKGACVSTEGTDGGPYNGPYGPY